MSRHRDHVRVVKQHQADSLCNATVIGQETRARGRVCQLETFVMASICFAVGAKTRPFIAMSSGEAELHAACMAAQPAMARELGVASRRHGIASGRQCGRWNHRQAGIGKLETSGLEQLVAAVSCVRKAGHLEESAVREQHGRSRDEGTREG